MWALPDMSHLKESLRYAYENRTSLELLGQEARKHMIERFSTENYTNILESNFVRINEKINGIKSLNKVINNEL